MFELVCCPQTHCCVCKVRLEHTLAGSKSIFSLMSAYVTSDMLHSDYIWIDLIFSSETDVSLLDSSVSLYFIIL